MKSSTVYGAVVGLLVGAGAVGLATTTLGEPPKETGKPAHDMKMPDDKMMEEMMKLAMPGEHHQEIAKFAGTWHGKVTHHDPMSGKVENSEGTMVSTLVLGGRWLRQEWKGEFQGQPFDGVGYWGYDNVKKQYKGLWMDTMSTAFMAMDGGFDAAKKVYTCSGETDSPMGPMTMKEVITIKDANHHTFDMFMPGPDGKDMKVMTIEYTKK